MAVIDILADHPDKETFDLAELHRAIRACLDCAASCAACSDTDLVRDPAAMRRCIQRCIDCKDVCLATASVLSRPAPSGHAWAKLVLACAEMCSECAAECGSHDHVCCQECAAACRECEQACQQLLAAAS